MFKKIKHLHFVGIGGSGMSGIAEVFHNLGYQVTGSDAQDSSVIKRLRSLGISISIGHKSRNVNGAHVVVISTAIPPHNNEVRHAHIQGIPVIPRIEMLAELARLKYTITVAGTHGKTTTTSMLSLIMREGRLDPTIIVGGIIKNIGTGATVGKGEYLIAEADESDGSFLKLSPALTVITNIDNDHLDYYHSMGHLLHAFTEHCNRVPFYGSVVVNGDDANIQKILPHLRRTVITFGLKKINTYHAENILFTGYDASFVFVKGDKTIGTITISIPGQHNVINAMAAAVAGMELAIPFKRIQKALKSFSGVQRRIEIKGEKKGVLVIDDYGHHPTEIDAVITAVKQIFPYRRLLVLFQPHRFTRTKLLHKEFVRALRHADAVRLLDIYPAAEKPIPGVHARLIADGLKKHGKPTPIYSLCDKRLLKELTSSDILLTLGAGPVWRAGEWVLKNI